MKNLSFFVGALVIGALSLLTTTTSALSPISSVLDNHHTNEQVFTLMSRVHQKCPEITHIYDLEGSGSVNGLPLRVIVFSDNASVHETLEPEFKYVGNMHGNEVVGRELMLELMVQLCDAYLAEGPNSNVGNLIRATRIHLLPTMNPDGWDIAVANEFKSLRASRDQDAYSSVSDMLLKHGVKTWMTGRQNANDVDLNRDFPDLDRFEFGYMASNSPFYDHLTNDAIFEMTKEKVDCNNKPFQPETLSVANWIVSNPFVLSANFHGGDLVANYPYDDSPTHRTVYSETPDDFVFVPLATSFAQDHAVMASNNRPKCDMVSDDFNKGITNGAKWYPVCGGMQDFNYLASNCFELTIELGCDKFPPGNQLANFWKDNHKAFYEFIWKSHMGIKGIVYDEDQNPVPNARVVVERLVNGKFQKVKHYMATSENGEYWRLLSPGVYKIFAFTIDGGLKSTPLEVTVDEDKYTEAQRVDIALKESHKSSNKMLKKILSDMVENDLNVNQ